VTAFIIRRLLIAVPVLFLASVLTFFLVINSGDPLENLRAKPGISPQVKKKISRKKERKRNRKVGNRG